MILKIWNCYFWGADHIVAVKRCISNNLFLSCNSIRKGKKRLNHGAKSFNDYRICARSLYNT